jgi:hypothetical protein
MKIKKSPTINTNEVALLRMNIPIGNFEKADAKKNAETITPISGIVAFKYSLA